MAAMPDPIDSLLQKRQRLLQDMQAIDRLRRGSLSQQFFKAAPGQTARRGPYFVLQGFFQGKKFSERVPAERAPQVQAEVGNEITRREAPGAESKKNSSRRNWPTNSSKKPKPS